ncbi:MAG: XdhC family protein [Actinomycetota bacterium]
MGELFRALARAIRENEPVALVTQVQGPNPGSKLLVREDSHEGTLGDEGLDASVVEQARAAIDMATTTTRTFGPQGQLVGEDVEVFIQAFSQPPEMLVFGAVNLANAVVNIGKFLGYHVTLVDARRVFATRDRFPNADEIVVQWPDEFLAEHPVIRRTAICILTHDQKFDIPLLKIALDTPAGYIGAMGSRKTHQKRADTLREEGVPDEKIDRIQAPLGLDIGAHTPEEVAVGIAGQIIAMRNGRQGGFLKGGKGRIHADAVPATA